jgi:hypothetical protein
LNQAGVGVRACPGVTYATFWASRIALSASSAVISTVVWSDLRAPSAAAIAIAAACSFPQVRDDDRVILPEAK